jgi:hypothetical protein
LIPPGLVGFFSRFFLARHFLIALGHRGLARQSHAPFFVHAKAFDGDFIADLDDVFGLFDAEVGEFADVDEAVLAGQELDERAEFRLKTELPGAIRV